MRLLFVCTGNTCRSPMAEALAGRKASERGLDIEVCSAGMMCGFGEKMADNAVAALKDMGITDFRHESQPVTQRLADDSDLIFTMTWQQKSSLAHFIDEDKIFTFRELAPFGDIPDPYGGDINVYRACAKTLDKALDYVMDYVAAHYLNGGKK